MKRIILAISVLLVFGLAVAAIAYKRSIVVETATASCCCCSGDSCPMKKDAAAKETASSEADCCKDGACPMKKTCATSEHHPESCPMKDKEGHASHTAMTQAQDEAMTADGKSCCCSCCNKQST